MSRSTLKVVFLLTLASWLLTTPVQALSFGDYGIAPGNRVAGRVDDNFHYQLAPGAVVNDSIKVINTGTSDLSLSLGLQSGQVSSDNVFSCQSGSSDGAVSWLSLESTKVSAAAGSVAQVGLTLNVPTYAIPGEHNACVTATPDLPSSTGGSGIQFHTQLALRVAITVPGNINWSLNIGKPKVIIRDKDVAINLAQTNNSSVSLRSQTAVSSIKGPNLSDSQTTVILPKATASPQLDGLPRPFWGGWYRVKLTATYQPAITDLSSNQSKTASRTIGYLVWPKPLAILAIILAILASLGAGLVLHKYKNRRNYKLRRPK